MKIFSFYIQKKLRNTTTITITTTIGISLHYTIVNMHNLVWVLQSISAAPEMRHH